jgi:hypothetical protein
VRRQKVGRKKVRRSMHQHRRLYRLSIVEITRVLFSSQFGKCGRPGGAAAAYARSTLAPSCEMCRSRPGRAVCGKPAPNRKCSQLSLLSEANQLPFQRRPSFTSICRRLRRTSAESFDRTTSPRGIIQNPSTGRNPSAPPATSSPPSVRRIATDCGTGTCRPNIRRWWRFLCP